MSAFWEYDFDLCPWLMLSPRENLATPALRIVVRDTDQDRPISMPDTTGSPDHSFTLTEREAGLCVEFSHAGNNLGRWLLNPHSAAGTAVCPRG
jgi:hypothetical protein